VLNYDDVLAKHRKVIYARRRELLMRNSEYMSRLWEGEVLDRSGERKELIINQRAGLREEVFNEVFARVALQSLDRLWMEHLEIMDQARRGVGLRAYGQREPLVEYAKEALRLYRELEGVFYNDITNFFANVDVESLNDAVNRDNKEDEEVSDERESASLVNPDYVTIVKDGEVRQIKAKKSPQWIEAGWKVVEAGKK